MKICKKNKHSKVTASKRCRNLRKVHATTHPAHNRRKIMCSTSNDASLLFADMYAYLKNMFKDCYTDYRSGNTIKISTNADAYATLFSVHTDSNSVTLNEQDVKLSIDGVLVDVSKMPRDLKEQLQIDPDGYNNFTDDELSILMDVITDTVNSDGKSHGCWVADSYGGFTGEFDSITNDKITWFTLDFRLFASDSYLNFIDDVINNGNKYYGIEGAETEDAYYDGDLYSYEGGYEEYDLNDTVAYAKYLVESGVCYGTKVMEYTYIEHEAGGQEILSVDLVDEFTN